MAPAKTAIKRDPVLVDLALQGGGSHGAFTWGVLDRLLEEPWLGIDGISGTSAGAMNAALLVSGHANGGAEGARTALQNFWRRVSEAARFSPFQRGPLDVLLGRWTLDSSPIYVAIDLMSRLLSPYDLNPMGNNPLRAILAELIDFDRLAQAPIKLFITATNVRTGRGHVFRNNAVTPDILLASACLPTERRAPSLPGEHTWIWISGLLKSADPIKCSIHSRRSIAERALPTGGSTRHSEAWEFL
jgi:NTE family protein